ncbi:MFS transporter [Nocardiopsis rhodophaea]|uniref:MFS transporter n=1 Tax=Nocardiopsis rhodophaea TaxID=280238 RepID=A0ABN2T6H9_9ACTN
MNSRYILRGYLAGGASARIGDEMSGPALLLLGLAVTGSATSGSALLAGVTISAVIGGPLLGVLLDRSDRPGRVLAFALAGYAAGLAAILVSLGRLPTPAVVGIALLTGLLGPALAGGWTSQLPRVAPAAGLSRATAHDAMTFSLASLVGPAAAGLVAWAAGAAMAVAVSVALIALALPAAWTLPYAHASPAWRPSGPRRSVPRHLVSGLRAIMHGRPLFRATATSTISYVGIGMFVVSCPLLAEPVFGDARHGALLLAAVAGAALAANALLARRPGSAGPPDRILWLSAVILAVAFSVALAAIASVHAGSGVTGYAAPLLITAAVVAGAADGPQLAALIAIRHREAPDHLRSQIFTTGASFKITGFAVGSALAGPLSTWSLGGALASAAGVEIAAALAYAACRAERPRREGQPVGDSGHRRWIA